MGCCRDRDEKTSSQRVMDQIDDEDVDEELERLKRKLDRLQSETPDEIRATEHNSNRHKQLDDNSFYRAGSSASSSLPLVYASV